MNLQELKNLSPAERATLLATKAIGSDEITYTITMTPEEILAYRERLVGLALEKQAIDDEFSDVKESFKQRLKPVVRAFNETLSSLRTGTKAVFGIVHRVPDYDTRTVYFVTEFGEILSKRAMQPEERQLTLNRQEAAI